MKRPAVALCFLLAAAGARAQDDDPMEIVRRALSRDGSLDTYAAEGVVREDRFVDGKPQVVETRFSIRLGRPDSYRIVWDGHEWKGAVWKAKGKPRVHLNRLAFEVSDDLEALRSTGGNSAQATVTIPSLFFPALETESALRRLAGFELLGTEAIGGEECWRIAGASPQGDRTELWISRKRLLVLQVRTTSRLHEQELAMQGRGRTVTEVHSEIRTEGGLTAADFAYEPPKGVVQERRAQDVPKVPEFDLARVRDVLAAPVGLFEEGMEVDRELLMRAMDELLQGSGRLHGVERSAIVDILPGPGDPLQRIHPEPRDIFRLLETGSVIKGRPRVVSPSYFATLGLGVVDGRPLTEEDHDDSRNVAVINMTLARKLWVGDSLSLPDSARLDSWEIVGVVEDGPEAQGVPEVYIPYAQAPLPPSIFVLVRAELPPPAVGDRLIHFLAGKDLPYGDVVSLEGVLAGQ